MGRGAGAGCGPRGSPSERTRGECDGKRPSERLNEWASGAGCEPEAGSGSAGGSAGQASGGRVAGAGRGEAGQGACQARGGRGEVRQGAWQALGRRAEARQGACRGRDRAGPGRGVPRWAWRGGPAGAEEVTWRALT